MRLTNEQIQTILDGAPEGAFAIGMDGYVNSSVIAHRLSDLREILELRQEIEQLQQRITELEAQLPKWVSVKDKLPQIDEWVLWFDGDRTMNPNNTQYHIDEMDKRGECLMNYLHNYTHWMPLPQPPKEKDHE